MPPIVKFSKDDIINVAYDIVKKEGFNSLNARRIAKELKSSIQPIFHNFKNMEELKESVNNKIYKKYEEYMLSGINEEKGYKNTGLSFIRFAKDYPEFFKSMFMQKTDLSFKDFVDTDNIDSEVIKVGQKFTGLSYEKQKEFQKKVSIFTFGIACLVSAKTVNFSDNEIDKLLGDTVVEMLKGINVKGEEKNE